MTVCPECQSVEFRVHGSLSLIEFKPWFFGLLGRKVPRVTQRAIEASCAVCHTAYHVREHSAVKAPFQQASDLLKQAQQKIASLSGHEKGQTETSTQPTRPQARPAPDPRVRRK